MEKKHKEREESLGDQAEHIKQQIQEQMDKDASKAKYGLGLVKAQKNLVTPGLLEHARTASSGSSRKIVTHSLEYPETPGDSTVDPYAKMPIRQRGPDGNFIDTPAPSTAAVQKELFAASATADNDIPITTALEGAAPQAAWDLNKEMNKEMDGQRSKVAYTPPQAMRPREMTPEYDESRDFRSDEERAADRLIREEKKREIEEQEQLRKRRLVVNRDGEMSPDPGREGFYPDLEDDGYHRQRDPPGGGIRPGPDSYNRPMELHKRDPRFAPPVNVQMNRPKHPLLPRDHDPYADSEEEEELSDGEGSPVRAKRHLIRNEATKATLAAQKAEKDAAAAKLKQDSRSKSRSGNNDRSYNRSQSRSRRK
jgi:hypothetical protein